MNNTVAGGQRPETFLESAQFAEKATIELKEKLGVLIKAIASQGPTVGKAFAKSAEFVKCESLSEFEKLAKEPGPTGDAQADKADDIAEELETLAVTLARLFASSLDDDSNDEYVRWTPVASLLRTLVKHSEVCSSFIMSQACDIRILKTQLGDNAPKPPKPEEVESSITRKVLLNRIKGLEKQAEVCAAFATCFAGSIDDDDRDRKIVAQELSAKVGDLYCSTLEASNGDSLRSLHEVIR